MVKQYLLFADFYVSVFTFATVQPKEILVRVFNAVKCLTTDESFDQILKVSKTDDSQSPLSIPEMEKEIKKVIDHGALAIAQSGYNPNTCSLSTSIYYRLVAVDGVNRFDLLPATKRLDDYFHLKIAALSNGIALN